MSSPKKVWILALWLVIQATSSISTGPISHTTEGDFAFDVNEEFQTDISYKTDDQCPVKKLWGVPDMPAYIGRVFKLQIPNEAFSGKISGYKASGIESPLPSWLTLDRSKGLLKGVPEEKDFGEHRLIVTALPFTNYSTKCPIATDTFTIEVKDKNESPNFGPKVMEQCHVGEDESRLIIVIERPLPQISTKQKLFAISKLASFMGLDQNAFLIQPHHQKREKSDQEIVLMSGLGDKKKKNYKACTEIVLTVGCSGKLWDKHNILVHQMKEQARDGSISYVTRLPVTSWKVVRQKQSHLIRKQKSNIMGRDEEFVNPSPLSSWEIMKRKQANVVRKPRAAQLTYEYEGSSDDLGDDEEYSGDDAYYEYKEDGDEATDDSERPLRTPSSSNVTETSNFDNEIFKQSNFDVLQIPEQNETKVVNSEDSEQTTIMVTEPSLRTSSIDFDMDTVIVNNASETSDIPFEVSPPSINTTSIESVTTERSSSIMGITTEIVMFTQPMNWPPQIQHRTKKVAVTAGKAFSYIIPEDLFHDREDGTNLKLAMYDTEHSPLKASSWVQFNPQAREVYGLPLEEHVSKWEYIVEATDSSGASANDTLDITVQQHKGRRTVNHEFSMKLKMQKKYPSAADWQIRILKGLVNLFRDTDMDQITVRDVDLNSDPVEFIWTNDTLPRNYCPKNDIDRLMGILQANSDGDPSPSLISAMSPELRIINVAWRGTNGCQAPPSTPAAPPAPPNHSDNYSPMPRNQIDQLEATVGKLLIFKVPEDTFYDPEDGSARNLKMWLTKGDRSPIPGHNWLQFDSKNQEFYGIPLERDKGRRDYQLVCEDSGGLTANDGLVVEVRPGPSFNPSYEFRMTIDIQHDSFMQSASSKRKFVEKLYHLFNDKDASSIKIKSITDSPTIISWYNVSLPTDKCPHEEIKQLKKILIKENDLSLNERVDEIMGPEFTVDSVSFDFKGICAVGTPVVAVPEVPPNLAGSNEDASKTVGSDDYIITFIVPIVVIICMIIIAALIACILYRRRRSGKMSVGDDEERQAFRSKGIPVIFQDELDEKPDPSNKTPVIMKEEKPPLLPPPEYKEVNSSSPTPSHTPYHPPPPFTTSRDTRNSRPKPTPTYRKPPPYVPP